MADKKDMLGKLAESAGLGDVDVKGIADKLKSSDLVKEGVELAKDAIAEGKAPSGKDVLNLAKEALKK